MDEDILYGIAAVVATLFAGLTILVPVVALTARFALRPVLETWMRMRQGQTSNPEQTLLGRRVALIEGELQQIQHTVQSLADAQEFQRQLADPAASHRAARPTEAELIERRL